MTREPARSSYLVVALCALFGCACAAGVLCAFKWAGARALSDLAYGYVALLPFATLAALWLIEFASELRKGP